MNVFRIIAGEYKGRKLLGPKGTEFRPTTGRVKEFIFSYLGEFIHQARVLDCFSGTGSLGLEALSRGAADVTFVEQSRGSLQILKSNLTKCRITENYRIVEQNVFSFFSQASKLNLTYDVVLADPPFKESYLNPILQGVGQYNLLNPEGLLIVEHECHDTDQGNHELTRIREKRFGACHVSVYE